MTLTICRCLSTFPSLTVRRICENNEPKQNIYIICCSAWWESLVHRELLDEKNMGQWLDYRWFPPMLRERLTHGVLRQFVKKRPLNGVHYVISKKDFYRWHYFVSDGSASVSGASLMLRVEGFIFSMRLILITLFISPASLVLWKALQMIVVIVSALCSEHILMNFHFCATWEIWSSPISKCMNHKITLLHTNKFPTSLP